MKVNRANLYKMISEVMEDDDLAPEEDNDSQFFFDHIMNLLSHDYEDALGGIDLYKSLSTPDKETEEVEVNFTPEEKQAIEQQWSKVQANEIILHGQPDEVIPKLQAINFNWHNEFTQVYGVTPPDIPFEVEPDKSSHGTDQIALRMKFGKNELDFRFWFDKSHPEHPTDPWIYMLIYREDGGLTNIYIDQTGGTLHVEYEGEEGDSEGEKITKEDVATIIRRELGWSPDEQVPEWPGLPKGQPPAEGPEGTEQPVYEARYSTVSDSMQRSEIERRLRQSRSKERSDLASELYQLKRKFDQGDFDDDRDWNRVKEIGKELEQKTQTPTKKEPTDNKYVKPAPCLSAKEEWAQMLIVLEGDIDQNWLDRVLATTRDEIALFGWGWILKKATQAAGGAFGWTYGGAGGALIVQELIDFAWNAAPRIIEDMAFRPQKAWGKPNIIEMFPILDQFDLDEAIYNMISPDAIGIIAKSYAEEVDAFIRSNPDACLDEIPEINDYYTDWLRSHPSMVKIMGRKTAGRKYMKSFRLTRESLFDTIAEVMSETGENFGATPSGDLLYEAWDDSWPSNFDELKDQIVQWTEKGKDVENILSKYALEAMSFIHLLGTEGGFLENGIWDDYVSLFVAFGEKYIKKDSPEETAIDQFINRSLSDDEGDNWFKRFQDARTSKGNEAGLKVLNMMISNLNKQIKKFWKKLGGDNADKWAQLGKEFNERISWIIRQKQRAESGMLVFRLGEIIKFVNMNEGIDNANKLSAFYKKIKKEGDITMSVLGNPDDVQIIGRTNNWIEEQLLNIDMTPCDDLGADYDAPCVLHQFDDKYFWYDLKSDSCELSAQKMNSCGDASMTGSTLYNLMSYGETGKPHWHIMIEWNEEINAIVQVLGNSNSVPRQEYWPYIKWFYEKFGNPEISNYAWEHVSGDNVTSRVHRFLQYLGLKSSTALTKNWTQMKQQIFDGFYNVKSYEGDNIRTEGDFSRLTWIAQEDRISMSMRIKRKLLKVGSEQGDATYDDVRDYKNAARRLQRTEVLADDYVINMIPREWDEFFDASNSNQRVRFSHGGNMVLYFNWTTNALQDPSFNEAQLDHQRENLAAFMEAAKRNFSVEAMNELGEEFGNHLAGVADDILMSRPAKDLDEESQKILSELLQLSVLDESQYYHDASEIDTDAAEQAIDLGQSLSGPDDRDRSEQVDKYVSLKVKKVLKDAIKTETMNAISMLVAEAADHIGLWSNSDDDAEYVSRTVNDLSNLYERALLRPLEAVKEFDGSQVSLDKWIDAMESVEKVLMKARDPAFYYLGKITPDYFFISDYYVTGEDDDWGEHTDRKDVKPRTAVKEAEEFFRPAIMKTIMGIQKRETGVDIGQMFGLSENKKD